MLLSIYIDLCHVEKVENKQKEAGIGPFLKKQFAMMNKLKKYEWSKN